MIQRGIRAVIVSGLVISSVWTTQIPAQAVFGGDRADDSPYVLTMLTGQEDRQSFCSMALIAERIVVTAAHCVIAGQSQSRELRFPIEDVFVSRPGADVTRDDPSTRVKVLRIVTHPEYINTWRPEVGDIRTQLHDIAFMFLAKPLVAGYSVPIATRSEVDAAVASGGKAVQFGYGMQSESLHSHSPWVTELPLLDTWPAQLGPRELFLMAQEGPTALCPGDSGGPWYIRVDGVMKFAAVTVAAGGCRGAPPYNTSALATRAHEYLPLLEAEWKRFLADEPGLQEAERIRGTLLDTSRADGTYASPGGCHGRIGVESQQLAGDGTWAKLTGMRGWLPSGPGCPSTHPFVPWTVVDAPDGTTLRWRYQNDDWVGFSEPFVWKRIPASPPPTPPTAATTPTGAPTAAPVVVKKVTITCVKGKASKKVTAVKPTCPKGFKRR